LAWQLLVGHEPASGPLPPLQHLPTHPPSAPHADARHDGSSAYVRPSAHGSYAHVSGGGSS
jgi:hypothetical protein